MTLTNDSKDNGGALCPDAPKARALEDAHPGTEADAIRTEEYVDRSSEKPDDTAGFEDAEGDQPEDPRLKALEAIAEGYYDEMYESSYPTGRYSDAKEAFYAAIALAKKLGRQKDVKRLEKRVEHVKEGFRRHFT